ncbi:hypothetical protein F4825DRAFT_447911 [Nemania diffusa]|nr:hypothetical protein F4825DRAFT_447911 [Nemania diffusa]
MAANQSGDGTIPHSAQETRLAETSVASTSEPTIQVTGSGGISTVGDGVAISDTEKLDDEGNTDKNALAETTGAGEGCVSTSTAPVNGNPDGLVNAISSMDFKAMFNDMNGRNVPIVTPAGSLHSPRPSEEIWNQVEQTLEPLASHDPNNQPKHKRTPRNRVPRNQVPRNQVPRNQVPRNRVEHNMPQANEPNLLDRHNKIMAAILTRFRNMVMAATEPLPTAAAIPHATLNAMTMNNEVSALIKEVENLLALNREIKQLWIAGPLRKPGDASQKNREKEIDEQAAKVSKMYNILVELEAETARKKNTAQQPVATAKDKQSVEVKKENANAHVKHENQGDSA